MSGYCCVFTSGQAGQAAAGGMVGGDSCYPRFGLCYRSGTPAPLVGVTHPGAGPADQREGFLRLFCSPVPSTRIPLNCLGASVQQKNPPKFTGGGVVTVGLGPTRLPGGATRLQV